MTKTAILLTSCRDRRGLVAAVTEFLHRNNGNIVHLDEHVGSSANAFFMRVEWQIDGFVIPQENIGDYFQTLIADNYGME